MSINRIKICQSSKCRLEYRLGKSVFLGNWFWTLIFIYIFSIILRILPGRLFLVSWHSTIRLFPDLTRKMQKNVRLKYIFACFFLYLFDFPTIQFFGFDFVVYFLFYLFFRNYSFCQKIKHIFFLKFRASTIEHMIESVRDLEFKIAPSNNNNIYRPNFKLQIFAHGTSAFAGYF